MTLSPQQSDRLRAAGLDPQSISTWDWKTLIDALIAFLTAIEPLVAVEAKRRRATPGCPDYQCGCCEALQLELQSAVILAECCQPMPPEPTPAATPAPTPRRTHP